MLRLLLLLHLLLPLLLLLLLTLVCAWISHSPCSQLRLFSFQSPFICNHHLLRSIRRETAPVAPAADVAASVLGQDVALELPRKQGLFRLEARDVGGGRYALLGSALLWVAAARDGTTLFWSHDRCCGGRGGGGHAAPAPALPCCIELIRWWWRCHHTISLC